MPAAIAASPPRGLARMLSWRRVRTTSLICVLLSVLLLGAWRGSYAVLLGRLLLIGLVELLVFGTIERLPRRLPRWIARWVLQVLGVTIAMPFIVAAAYMVTTIGIEPPWYQSKEYQAGFGLLTVVGLLVAPWIAISAVFRQINGEAQRQALAFELERSEYQRNALDTRLRLLQAQVEPHFLFNTLANVRELVDSGSAQASAVLGSLISYLRAAVPRLNQVATTVAQEVELVRAYLEVMHMRMPDRLQFTLLVDESSLPLHCPPSTLLTLVENAVRHGIDPSEQGGRIEVRVAVRDGRCHADVIDTGIGLRPASDGLGTGLSTLRERLHLAFAGDAKLQLRALDPHGVCAALDFPAQTRLT